MEISGISIEGTAITSANGIALIKQVNPDLVLLDIEIDQLNGFDLLNALEQINFQTVFMTAHDHYAIKAIKFSAVDYLLKPFDKAELFEAIEKTKKNKRSNIIAASALLSNNHQQNFQKQKIGLHTFEGISYVLLEDIIRCKAEGNYTEFNLINGQNILVSSALKKYEDLLNEFGFFRIHKSHLINLSHVSSFSKAEGGYVIMDDGIKIEISRRKKGLFLNSINSINSL